MNEAHESCDGCKHDLGGGRDNCRLNLSYECRDGGGFEAWEAAEKDAAPKRTKTENLLVRMLLILCFISYPIALYNIYEWIRYFIG